MMKSYILDSGITLNDLVERYQGAEKVHLFQGRRPKLAFKPKGSIVMGWDDINIRRIIDFCQNNTQKGNLIIGFFSYETGLYSHGLTPRLKPKLPLVQLYAFENWLEEENGTSTVKYKDEDFLKIVKNLVKQPAKKAETPKLSNKFQPNWDIHTYRALFEKAKDYIRSGDIYQLNLTYPFLARSTSSAKDIYLHVQAMNRSFMAGVFQSDSFDLISFSPETFINIEGRQIETFPIKGTRAKNKITSDNQTENELLNDNKEKAELNMISDLLRNDLSLVCKINSVKIKSRQNTSRLKRVIHTYSHITGELQSDISPIEAMIKMLPGGSISGCPKRRALEVIDELEGYSRGPYSGALFTLDPQENLEASILIRTLIKEGDLLSLPVGGGIVFDSNYQAEYKETFDKASSIVEAFDLN